MSILNNQYLGLDWHIFIDQTDCKPDPIITVFFMATADRTDNEETGDLPLPLDPLPLATPLRGEVEGPSSNGLELKLSVFYTYGPLSF